MLPPFLLTVDSDPTHPHQEQDPQVVVVQVSTADDDATRTTVAGVAAAQDVGECSGGGEGRHEGGPGVHERLFRGAELVVDEAQPDRQSRGSGRLAERPGRVPRGTETDRT